MKKILVCLILCSWSTMSWAIDATAVPHVDKKARDGLEFDYAYAAPHKAFVIAPGGAWSWQAGKSTVEEAKKASLDLCAKYTQQKCIVYAVDNDVVFERSEWIKLWGPYKKKAEAKQALTGITIGDRFPNVEFTDPNGKKKTLSDLKGKVVFLHFWGQWCPSCRHEFSSIIEMYRILKDTVGEEVEFVVLQLREPIDESRNWARSKGLDALPLSDSGVKDSEDNFIRIKGNKLMRDRNISRVFPTTYVLDKHGLVVFANYGSVENWTEYIPFFHDAVAGSGK